MTNETNESNARARLSAALEFVVQARSFIAENRGPEKEEAREGYEAIVSEGLVPVLLDVVEAFVGDAPPREVERLAQYVLSRLDKLADVLVI